MKPMPTFQAQPRLLLYEPLFAQSLHVGMLYCEHVLARRLILSLKEAGEIAV